MDGWIEGSGWPRAAAAALLALLAAAGVARAQSAAAPTLARDMIPDDMPPEVRKQVERLYSEDPGICLAAAKALEEMGPRAKSAAPFLATMLRGHFGSAQPNAAGRALIRIGRDAVDALVLELSVSSEDARRRAAYVLGVLGDPRAVDPLIDAFAAGLGGMAQLGALRRLGIPARERVLRALKSGGPDRRRGAARALVAFSRLSIQHRMLGDGAGAISISTDCNSRIVVEALLDALSDKDRDVRLAALESLRIVATSCDDARVADSTPLRDVLDDPDPDVRRQALAVAALAAGDAKIDWLIRRMSDPDAAVRGEAIRQLSSIKDARALEAVAAVAESKDDAVRPAAIRTLAAAQEQRYVPLLARLLDDGNPAVRMAAAGGLGEFGGAAAAGHLPRLLDDRDPAVRRECALWLGRLRAADAEKPLRNALEDASQPVRVAAALALGRCGGEAGLEALMRLTESNDAHLRYEAARALAERLLDLRGGRWDNRRNRRMTGSEKEWDLRSGLRPLPNVLRDAALADRVRGGLARLLDGPDPDLHAVAAEGLIDVEGRLDVPHGVLLAALKSPASDARWVALEHLSCVRWTPDDRFLEPLRRAAGLRLASASLWGPVLLRMGKTEALLDLCDRLLKNGESKIARMAPPLLGRMGDAGLDLPLLESTVTPLLRDAQTK